MHAGSLLAGSDAGAKWAFVDDDVFVDLYNSASAETNEEKRIELSKQAQQRLYDERLAVP